MLTTQMNSTPAINCDYPLILYLLGCCQYCLFELLIRQTNIIKIFPSLSPELYSNLHYNFVIFSDFESFYNPLHGNCYVFNSGWNTSKPLRVATRSGQSSGEIIGDDYQHGSLM